MENLFTASNEIRPTGKRKQLPQSDPQRNHLARAFCHTPESGTRQLTDQKGRFIIVWLKSGSLSVLHNGESRVIKADRFFCLLPGYHFDLVPSDDMEAYIVSLSEDFLLMAGGREMYAFSKHQAGQNGPLFILEIGDKRRMPGIESLMKLVIRNGDTNYHFGIESFKGLLQVLAVYFCRNEGAPSPPEPVRGYDEQLFRKFMRQLDLDYVTKKSVMEYAKALAVTPNYLSDTVKRASGHTASFHIQQRIITEAKRAAGNAHVSMKEVAYRVGFMDIAHFSKFFRTHTGMNFTDFKNLLA